MFLKPIDRTNRGKNRLYAALSIYRETILPEAQNPERQILYWIEHSKEVLADEFKCFALQNDHTVVGYLQYSFFIEEQLFFFEYLCIRDSKRPGLLPSRAIRSIEQFLAQNYPPGFSIVFEVARRRNSSQQWEPDDKLIGYFKRLGFRTVDFAYHYPVLQTYDGQTSYPADLMVLLPDQRVLVSASEMRTILRCIYFKHYLRWDRPFLQPEQFMERERLINKLYSHQVQSIGGNDSFNTNGDETDAYAFDSFGVVANSEGDSPQPFRYLGRYGIMDDGNGLYHARARYFSPQLGRFATKDPVTGKDSDGQSLNRYVYALNNPLKWLDVSGLSAQEGGTTSGNIFGQLNFGDLPRESIEWLLREIGSRLELYVDTGYGRVTIGQLRLSPGNVIDLHGIGRTLRLTARASTVYGVFQSSQAELRARGVDFSTLGESIMHIDENLTYALHNPLEAWQSVDDALTSYSAVFLNTYTLNLFQLRGDQIQQGVNAYINLFQLP
ncbi:MAG: RHS repeat-associated core domain-containing protein [Candidatus Paceibacterota bacterium]|jgi:RHS repeat-associated protein